MKWFIYDLTEDHPIAEATVHQNAVFYKRLTDGLGMDGQQAMLDPGGDSRFMAWRFAGGVALHFVMDRGGNSFFALLREGDDTASFRHVVGVSANAAQRPVRREIMALQQDPEPVCCKPENALRFGEVLPAATACPLTTDVFNVDLGPDARCPSKLVPCVHKWRCEKTNGEQSYIARARFDVDSWAAAVRDHGHKHALKFAGQLADVLPLTNGTVELTLCFPCPPLITETISSSDLFHVFFRSMYKALNALGEINLARAFTSLTYEYFPDYHIHFSIWPT